MHYHNGDDGSAAKEVYHTEASNVNSAHGGWKKRRICGMPIIVFIAILALVLVGGIAGGVGGGVVGMKKTNSNPPAAITTTPPAPTNTAVSTTDPTAIDASTALPSSTDSAVPYPTPDLPSNWWHSIENSNLLETGDSALTNIYKDRKSVV